MQHVLDQVGDARQAGALVAAQGAERRALVRAQRSGRLRGLRGADPEGRREADAGDEDGSGAADQQQPPPAAQAGGGGLDLLARHRTVRRRVGPCGQCLAQQPAGIRGRGRRAPRGRVAPAYLREQRSDGGNRLGVGRPDGAGCEAQQPAGPRVVQPLVAGQHRGRTDLGRQPRHRLPGRQRQVVGERVPVERGGAHAAVPAPATAGVDEQVARGVVRGERTDPRPGGVHPGQHLPHQVACGGLVGSQQHGQPVEGGLARVAPAAEPVVIGHRRRRLGVPLPHRSPLSGRLLW